MIGAALRLWQYAANSSLWIDELALSRNIIDRGVSELLQPLDYAQSAPAGFLLIEKALSTVFGTGEFALRAFPLLCGLCALGLFWAVTTKVVSGWTVPYAVGLFSLGIPFIYFSSQVKQYSSDVAAALLLVWATLATHRQGVTRARAFWLGVLGAALAWFSQPAVFVMAGIGTGLAILAFKEGERHTTGWFGITCALWAASAAAVVTHSLGAVGELDREYFQWFWSGGFMPVPPRTLSELAWLPGKLTWVFGAFGLGLGHTNGGLNYRWSPLFTAVMLYGYWVLWRKQRDAALFLSLPVVVAVGLSALALYPFTARLLAFLIPFFILALAVGASEVLARFQYRFQFLSAALLAVLVGAPIYAVATALPPSWVQHFRPIMAHVSQWHEPGDRIYVYSGGGLAFSYYAPRFGVDQNGVILGRCALNDARSYLRELDSLRGQKRVWLVATHEQREGELQLILGYLDQLGRRLDAVVERASSGRAIENAYGYLYDLSDRERLSSVSADTYALPVAFEPMREAAARWGCHGVTGGAQSRQP